MKPTGRLLTNLSAALVGACMTTSVCAGGTDAWNFDFGSAQSPVWQDFTQVTHATRYDRTQGFGWLEPFPTNAQSGTHHVRKGALTTDPDDLTCDYVETNSRFRVDVPPGSYRVTVIVGDIGGGLYRPNTTYNVLAQGKHAVTVPIDRNNFYRDYYFRNKDWEFTPQTDVFEELYRPRLPEHTFSADAPDGKIVLQIQRLPLLAVMIRPAAQARQMQAELTVLAEARKKQFDDEVIAIQWPQVEEPEPPVTDADRSNGYVLFARNIMERVLPRSRPRVDELRPAKVAMFAAPGEYESVGLSVYPLERLAGANLTLVGDLVAEGARLRRDAVTVRRITYCLSGSRYKNELAQCHVLPSIIRDAWPVAMFGRWCVRYWITVKVPDDARPGVYRGTLRFGAEGKPSQDVELQVRVLPFRLRDDPAVARGFFYYVPRWYRRYGFEGMEDRFWQAVERDLMLLAEYGFNTFDSRGLVKINVEDGKVRIDFADADRFWELYRKVGLRGEAICSDGAVGTGPLVGQRPFGLPPELPYDEPADRQLLKQTVALFRDHALQANWPGAPKPLMFWCTDELAGRSEGNVDLGIALLELYRQVPGIRTYCSINGADELRMLDQLDLVSMNSGVDVTQEVIDQVHEAGCRLGFYNIGGTRFSYGFYLWKTRGVINLSWNWNNPKQDPFVQIDGNRQEDSYAYQTDDAIYPTYRLELAREGVDDLKYLMTLQSLLAEARRADAPAVREAVAYADRVLKLLGDMTTVEIRTFLGPGRWSPQAYQRARTLIAQAILRLRQVPDELDPVVALRETEGAVWWNRNFAYRMPVHVNAGAQRRERPLVRLRVDFSSSVQTEQLDRNSVRVIGLTEDGPAEVPATCSWTDSGAADVTWMMDQALAPLAGRKSHIYFDTLAHGRKVAPDYRALPWAAEPRPGQNLLRNGGFEMPDEQDPSLPAHWRLNISGQDKQKARVALAADSVHSGARAVRFDTDSSDVRITLRQRLPHIKPNTSYRLTFRARAPRLDAGKHTMIATVHLYDAEGKPAAPNCKIDTWLVGTCGWMRASGNTVVVGTTRVPRTPPNVAYGILTVGPYQAAATVYLDDVTFEEVGPGLGAPLPIYIGPIESRPSR